MYYLGSTCITGGTRRTTAGASPSPGWESRRRTSAMTTTLQEAIADRRAEQRVERYPLLIGFEPEWVDPRRRIGRSHERPVDDLGARELEPEPFEVVGEIERIGFACEGDFGLRDQELADEKGELAVADLEQVDLVAEEDGVEHLARGRQESPAVDAAEVVHGQVARVVAGDASERPRRRVPDEAEEIEDLPAVEDERKDESRVEEEEGEDFVVELPVGHGGERGFPFLSSSIICKDITEEEKESIFKKMQRTLLGYNQI